MPELLFYTTSGCHLCEYAAELLAELASSRQFTLTPVDISESEDLVARYGLTIPVLRNPATGRELNWPFAPEQVVTLLDSAIPKEIPRLRAE